MWSPRIQKAIDTAAVAHAAQERRGNPLPFIVHVVGVAAILAQCGVDEDTVIAGYLHDILEDVQPEIYSRDDMLQNFGEHVTEIVDGVTEDKSIRNWRERKAKYLEGLKHDSEASLLVSAADMANNMHSIHTEYLKNGPDAKDIFDSTPEDRLWFYSERYKFLCEKLDGHPVMQILAEQWEMAKTDTTSLIKS